MLYIHVAAGKAVTEDYSGVRLSPLTLYVPISTMQDIIDKGACDAALVSGEVCIRDLHGIILQAVAASGQPPCCKPICSSPIMQAFCSMLLQLLVLGAVLTTCSKAWLMPCRSAWQSSLHPIGLSKLIMKINKAWEWAGQCSCPTSFCHQKPPSRSSSRQASPFTPDQVS